MSILKRVEKGLDDKLRKIFSTPEGEARPREPLEIYRGILEEVATKLQPAQRGKRIFPYNHLLVEIPVAEAGSRPALDAVFGDGQRLAAEIREAVHRADVRVEIAFLDGELPQAAARGFHIVYSETGKRRELGRARFLVLNGTASQEDYVFTKERINIGRLPEVIDGDQRVIRRNDLIFAETGEGVNATVSRSHAHIGFDMSSGEYRLHDDHSAYGTSVFRDGALIAVPAGAGRGVVLRNGDEIYFGQARVRFETAA